MPRGRTVPNGAEGARQSERGEKKSAGGRRDFPGCSSFGLHAPNVGGPGSILGQGTGIPHAMQCGQKMKNNNK